MQFDRIVFEFTKSYCKETVSMYGLNHLHDVYYRNIARLKTRRYYVIIENRLSSDSAICLESNEAKFLETEH